jgi:energy-coupling factor transport system permease protein
VLVPVVLTAIEDSVLLAEAMEARGFGAGRRTSYSGTGWSRRDVAVAAASVGAAVLFIGLHFTGAPIDWYPYPTIYLPPVNPVLLVGCLMLAAPAIAWPVRPSRGR